MKTLLFIPFLLTFFRIGPTSDPPMPDPSAVYCKFLGYDYAIRKDYKGNENAFCIFPDGSECSTWSFYRGICGQKYSYCSKKGCETKSITEDNGSYRVTYCACVCRDSIGNKISIPLNHFMEQNGDTLIKPANGQYEKGE